MEKYTFGKNKLNLTFVTDDQNRFLLKSLGNLAAADKVNPFFVPVEIFATGANPNAHHGVKHIGSELSDSLRYKSHTETETEVVVVLENDTLRVKQHYIFYPDANVVRAFAEAENIGTESVGLEYISSLCLYEVPIDKIMLCHNFWCRELEWRTYTPYDLGYHTDSFTTTKRINISNTGTWSTKEFMPMAVLQNENGALFFQIEHIGSWNFEISDTGNSNYLKLSGPSEQENNWWKNLAPGESFQTVPVAVAFGKDFNDVVAQMTQYRRHIGYMSPGDKDLPVIFNDYMGCLGADPTTEREIPVIDVAAELGAEIYCMDAGWYAEGGWWDSVGEWSIYEPRFPNGLGEVFDYVRKKGMKPGIWLEPESMGIRCPILDQFSDECFFMRHGKRIIDHGRYHLDFRCKQVTDHLNRVVDRLVNDFGIAYFKFDYNIDGGVGTELSADSFGDGLLQHQEAYLAWIDSLYARYPDLIIENCASGGMRMDYKSLAHFTIQSTTDTAGYKTTAPIVAMAPTAMLPRQAQVWVVPKTENSLDEIAFDMANALFRRPALSGQSHMLSAEQKEVIKQGVALYKQTRSQIHTMVPFYPMGTIDSKSEWAVYGFKNEEKAYLFVGHLGEKQNTIDIPLTGFGNACVVYPKTVAPVSLEKETLSVSLPQNSVLVYELQKA